MFPNGIALALQGMMNRALLLLLLLLNTACEPGISESQPGDDEAIDETESGVTRPPPSAVITTLSPMAGAAGTPVRIIGTNLNTYLQPRVYFGGVESRIVTIASTFIDTVVPVGAIPGPVTIRDSIFWLVSWESVCPTTVPPPGVYQLCSWLPRYSAYEVRSPMSFTTPITTRFVNNTSLTMRSLRADGVELLSGDLLRGQQVSLLQWPGQHTALATTVGFNGPQRVDIESMTIIHAAGGSVTFQDPTLVQELNGFPVWRATFLCPAGAARVGNACFSELRFFSGGGFEWWIDEGQRVLAARGLVVETAAFVFPVRRGELRFNGVSDPISHNVALGAVTVTINGISVAHAHP